MERQLKEQQKREAERNKKKEREALDEKYAAIVPIAGNFILIRILAEGDKLDFFFSSSRTQDRGHLFKPISNRIQRKRP